MYTSLFTTNNLLLLLLLLQRLPCMAMYFSWFCFHLIFHLIFGAILANDGCDGIRNLHPIATK